MAANSLQLFSEPSKKKKHSKRKGSQRDEELDKRDLLKWHPSVSNDENDPFSLLVGSSELDGGEIVLWL